MTLSKTQFIQMIPAVKNADEWYPLIVEYFAKYDINTRERIAGFMAQAGHESSDFNSLVENMNYSWKALRSTFKRYFPTDAMAKQYERKPEMIANRVYDDALRINKIGNTQPGDGWRFIGRGIFQLSGRTNYTNFGKTIGKTAEEAAEYCKTKRGAVESACWFWKTRGAAAFADRKDITGLSNAINGGNIGLADRKVRWDRALRVLDIPSVNTSPTPTRALSLGSRGDDVKRVQTAFKFPARECDGIFGNNTRQAVLSWQRTNKFTATGTMTIDQQKRLLGI
jgi:putative chitinase